MNSSSDAMKDSQSELSPVEIERVKAFVPDQKTLDKVAKIIQEAAEKIGLHQPVPEVIEMAAQIYGALGENRIPKAVEGGVHKLWLLTEAYINTGRDPSEIHQAAMGMLLFGETQGTESRGIESLLQANRDIISFSLGNQGAAAVKESPDDIRKKIQELEKLAEMPLPPKPKEGADAEEMNSYRKQLVTRHLRERLSRKGGQYCAINMENLYEVLLMIIENVPFESMSKLHKEISEKIVPAGAKVDGWLSRVSQEQFDQMVEIIAASGLPINEETRHEKFVRAMKSPYYQNYVAKDVTIENEISDLHRKLRD